MIETEAIEIKKQKQEQEDSESELTISYSSSPTEIINELPKPLFGLISTKTEFIESRIDFTKKKNKTKENYIEGVPSDFIVLSEFCEQQGPVDVFVYPPWIKHTYNIATLVLKTMSTDYQRSKPNMLISEDSQFVITLAQNAYAYAHHFTLYDANARGYVRPACFTYVSNRQDKLMRNFASLIHEFSKLINQLKAHNQLLFFKEIQIRLFDLENSIEQVLINEKQNKKAEISSDENGSRYLLSIPNTSFERMLNDTSFLKNQIYNSLCNLFFVENILDIYPHPNSNKQKGIKYKYQEENFIPKGYKAKYVSHHHKTVTLDRKLRHFREICIPEVFEACLENVKTIHNLFKQNEYQKTLRDYFSELAILEESFFIIGAKSHLSFSLSPRESIRKTEIESNGIHLKLQYQHSISEIFPDFEHPLKLSNQSKTQQNLIIEQKNNEETKQEQNIEPTKQKQKQKPQTRKQNKLFIQS
eukprot:Anaeramoba_ignava/a608569_18.p1 GENE.a608569_18~~a608569_18.p1  ORF type:complete len:473 (-),score=148.23 a608569_18:559-1977(-)